VATYSRREVTTHRAEYTVPDRGDGAPWAEVMKAVRAAHQELVALGRIRDGKDAPDNMITIGGDGEDVIVAFEWEDRHTKSPEFKFQGFQTTAWAVWRPDGTLLAVAHGRKVDDAWNALAPEHRIELRVPDCDHAVHKGLMESVNAHEAEFLRYHLHKASLPALSIRPSHVVNRDTWRAMRDGVVKPMPRIPYAWALWDRNGALKAIDVAREGSRDVDSGWSDMWQHVPKIGRPPHPQTSEEAKDDGWDLDALTEAEYEFLHMLRGDVMGIAGSRDRWRAMRGHEADIP
jgi:hypothetical protein